MTRVTRKSAFAAIPNAAMRDETISIEARGLLALMMGMGDRWVYRSMDLMKRCCVGKEKYQRMMRELREAGYVEMVPKQSEGGKLDGYDYVIHDATGCLKTRQPVEPPDGKPGTYRIPTSKNTNLKTPLPPQGESDPDLFSANGETVPQEPAPDPIAEGFNGFWSDWPKGPRKSARADCEKVYRAACTGKHPKSERLEPAVLNRAAQLYVDDLQRRGSMDFIKGPLPWLRLPGWEPFLDAAQAPHADDRKSRVDEILKRFT